MQVASVNPPLTEQATDTKDQLTELTKAVGRGATALRDTEGNIIEMGGGVYPLLVAPQQDVAIGLTLGAVAILDPTTAEPRGLSTGTVFTNGEPIIAGTAQVTDVNCSDISCVGGIDVSADLSVLGDAHLNSVSAINIGCTDVFARDLNATRNLSVLGDTHLNSVSAINIGAQDCFFRDTNHQDVFVSGTINVTGDSHLNALSATNISGLDCFFRDTNHEDVFVSRTLNVTGDTHLNAVSATNISGNDCFFRDTNHQDVFVSRSINVTGNTNVNNISATGIGCSNVSTSGLSVFGASHLNDISATGIACSNISTSGLSVAGASHFNDISTLGIGCTGISATGISVFGDSHLNNISAVDIFARGASFSGNCNANSFTPTSDRRLKRDIRRPVRSGLARIADFPVREFRWREGKGPEGPQLGFIAQDMPADVQRVDAADGTVGYDLGPVLASSVAAIQELRALVTAQADQITALTARVADLEAA